MTARPTPNHANANKIKKKSAISRLSTAFFNPVNGDSDAAAADDEDDDDGEEMD